MDIDDVVIVVAIISEVYYDFKGTLPMRSGFTAAYSKSSCLQIYHYCEVGIGKGHRKRDQK